MMKHIHFRCLHSSKNGCHEALGTSSLIGQLFHFRCSGCKTFIGTFYNRLLFSLLCAVVAVLRCGVSACDFVVYFASSKFLLVATWISRKQGTCTKGSTTYSSRWEHANCSSCGFELGGSAPVVKAQKFCPPGVNKYDELYSIPKFEGRPMFSLKRK